MKIKELRSIHSPPARPIACEATLGMVFVNPNSTEYSCYMCAQVGTRTFKWISLANANRYSDECSGEGSRLDERYIPVKATVFIEPLS